MHTVTFYHKDSKQLRTVTSPQAWAALLTAEALRAAGYVVRVWSHQRKHCPELIY